MEQGELQRICPYDGSEMIRMWESVGAIATTEIKHDEGSYFQKLASAAKARAFPYVCSKCGLLQYFLDPDGLQRLFPSGP